MGESDRDLVAQVRAGNRAVFRHLVERWTRSVFRLAYRMTGNEADAEDIVQETFLRAYRELHRYEERSSFGTWIYRIAANCSLDLLRARSRQANGDLPELVSESPLPDRLSMSEQFRDRFHRSLHLLTDQERAAFLLRHFEGQSIEQIAGALDLSATATKNSIFRAVQKLRRALEPHYICTSPKTS